MRHHGISGDRPWKDCHPLRKNLIVYATQGLWVNEARIIKPDVQATNGTIHVIDTVLMPGTG